MKAIAFVLFLVEAILAWSLVAIAIIIGAVRTLFTGLAFGDWDEEIWTEIVPRELHKLWDTTVNMLTL